MVSFNKVYTFNKKKFSCALWFYIFGIKKVLCSLLASGPAKNRNITLDFNSFSIYLTFSMKMQLLHFVLSYPLIKYELIRHTKTTFWRIIHIEEEISK